jgi:hypothetical protein
MVLRDDLTMWLSTVKYLMAGGARLCKVIGATVFVPSAVLFNGFSFLLF